tara:strand:- start:819 stop:1187 length:369 start_codon:yes stop_codon:yes gene_type:complete
MPRIKKQKIEVNCSDSLQGLLQETYNNVCNQMKDAQKVINELTTASNPDDVDEWVKVSKAKTDALKIKDSAIKIKLDIGKLQNEVIKHSGNASSAIAENPMVVSNDSFAKVRELLKERENNE